MGLVCIRVFGYQDPAAEPLAERVGQAFQLTNIIRDIKEDAIMGRIYLPEEDFAKFGISPYELYSPPNPSRFAPLLEMEANRAREFYRAADQLIPMIEEDSQPALWALVAIYRRLLGKDCQPQLRRLPRKNQPKHAREAGHFGEGNVSSVWHDESVDTNSQGSGGRWRAGGLGSSLRPRRHRFARHAV